jgi:hypothetical protein
MVEHLLIALNAHGFDEGKLSEEHLESYKAHLINLLKHVQTSKEWEQRTGSEIHQLLKQMDLVVPVFLRDLGLDVEKHPEVKELLMQNWNKVDKLLDKYGNRVPVLFYHSLPVLQPYVEALQKDDGKALVAIMTDLLELISELHRKNLRKYDLEYPKRNEWEKVMHDLFSEYLKSIMNNRLGWEDLRGSFPNIVRIVVKDELFALVYYAKAFQNYTKLISAGKMTAEQFNQCAADFSEHYEGADMFKKYAEINATAIDAMDPTAQEQLRELMIKKAYEAGLADAILLVHEKSDMSTKDLLQGLLDVAEKKPKNLHASINCIHFDAKLLKKKGLTPRQYLEGMFRLAREIDNFDSFIQYSFLALFSIYLEGDMSWDDMINFLIDVGKTNPDALTSGDDVIWKLVNDGVSDSSGPAIIKDILKDKEHEDIRFISNMIDCFKDFAHDTANKWGRVFKWLNKIADATDDYKFLDQMFADINKVWGLSQHPEMYDRIVDDVAHWLKKGYSNYSLSNVFHTIETVYKPYEGRFSTGLIPWDDLVDLLDFIGFESFSQMWMDDNFKKFLSVAVDDENIGYLIKLGKKIGPEVAFFIIPLFKYAGEDISSGKLSREQVETFISNLVKHIPNLKLFSLVPEDVVGRGFKNLNSNEIIATVNTINGDERYFTVQGLNEMGFLVCHVTNAFGGGAALEEGEERRSDVFANIVFCLEHQGLKNFPLSASSIHPNLPRGLADTGMSAIMGGPMGVFFDSGYIYQSFSRDAATLSKVNKKYRTGLAGLRVNTYYATTLRASVYNELLLRKWTVGGFFYVKGVKQEPIDELKHLSDQYSNREYLNPEWIVRKLKIGSPKKIVRTYPIYEIDLETKKWKKVYSPVKRDSLEEFKELLETCDADACRALVKKGGMTKFIPEWDRLTSDETGWQHRFHDFRLDEHTISLIEYFDKSKQFHSLSDYYQRMLRVAAILHDIMKTGGYKGEKVRPDSEHPEKGAEKALEILQRLKYAGDDLKLIYRLISFHDAIGNIVIYGDRDDRPVTVGRKKVKHSKAEMAKHFEDDELEVLAVFTKADIYSVQSGGKLLKETRNFWTFREMETTGIKYTTEEAIDLCVEEILATEKKAARKVA